jgi:ribosomal-protein-alanine N-acetyltransferase
MPSPKRTSPLPAPDEAGLRFAALAPQHADALAAVHACCFARGWSADDFQRFAAADHCLGLVVWAGTVVEPAGFVIANVAAGEAEILTLAVGPIHRRRGLARAMLRQLVARLAARDVLELFLEVESGNLAALRLYEQAGLQPAGRRSGYYSTPEGPRDALILRKVIDAGI